MTQHTARTRASAPWTSSPSCRSGTPGWRNASTWRDDSVSRSRRASSCPSTSTARPRYDPTAAAWPTFGAGQYEGLRDELGTNPDRDPDYGPARIHPRGGAVAVGARKPLIAFNVNLANRRPGARQEDRLRHPRVLRWAARGAGHGRPARESGPAAPRPGEHEPGRLGAHRHRPRGARDPAHGARSRDRYRPLRAHRPGSDGGPARGRGRCTQPARLHAPTRRWSSAWPGTDEDAARHASGRRGGRGAASDRRGRPGAAGRATARSASSGRRDPSTATTPPTWPCSSPRWCVPTRCRSPQTLPRTSSCPTAWPSHRSRRPASST